jgi:hypothetical protein
MSTTLPLCFLSRKIGTGLLCLGKNNNASSLLLFEKIFLKSDSLRAHADQIQIKLRKKIFPSAVAQ